MITRFLAKKLVGFETIDLELKPGLVAITGPSGAGKSVFMSALLALFGLDDAKAAVSEAVLEHSDAVDLEDFDDEEEAIRIRAVKKEKVRYYLNDLTVSKKRLKAILSPLVRHIAQRDNRELSPAMLLRLLDREAATGDRAFVKLAESFKKNYRDYKEKEAKLRRLKEDEKRVKDLIEFAEFEIKKIDEIAPRVGEDEELMAIKRQLSKKEKIAEAIAEASRIFESEEAVSRALELIEGDDTLFTEAMNTLRAEFERARERLSELDEVDVEQVLDRIEKLAELKRRYGSIEEALAYRDEKLKELERLMHLSHDLQSLEDETARLKLELTELGERLTHARRAALPRLQKRINSYLTQLRLANITLRLEKEALLETGFDRVDLSLGESGIETLSGGEFNRIRLALLLCKSELEGGEGVLLIDEIDANVSGDESIAIARLLKKLSKTFQIVAISHQPHLSAAADMQVLVHKKGNKSEAIVLSPAERIAEISRMIAGEGGMEEAKNLAENLLKEFSK